MIYLTKEALIVDAVQMLISIHPMISKDTLNAIVEAYCEHVDPPQRANAWDEDRFLGK